MKIVVCDPTGEEAGGPTDRQAGGQPGRQAGGQAGGQAGNLVCPTMFARSMCSHGGAGGGGGILFAAVVLLQAADPRQAAALGEKLRAAANRGNLVRKYLPGTNNQESASAGHEQPPSGFLCTLLSTQPLSRRCAVASAARRTVSQPAVQAAVDAQLDAGALADQPDGDGATALAIAAARGYLAVLEKLLRRSADPVTDIQPISMRVQRAA